MIKQNYQWQAQTELGDPISGLIISTNKAFAQAQLEIAGFKVVRLSFKAFCINHQRLSHHELELFFNQFGLMYCSGISILESIQILKLQFVSRPILLSAIIEIEQRIKRGDSLSMALESLSGLFPRYLCKLIAIGEATGRLESVLKYIKNFINKQQQLKKNIMSALWYPAMVLMLCILLVLALFWFVVPQFKEMYELVSQPLPALTNFMISIYSLLNQWTSWLLLFVGTFIVIGVSFADRIKQIVLLAITFLPLFKTTLYSIQWSLFARLLHLCIRSGLSWQEAIALTKHTIFLKSWKNQIKIIETQVLSGYSITESMRGACLFSPPFMEMIAIGEKVGKLDESLCAIADNYQEQFETDIRTYLVFLEPILVLVVGSIVGLLVVALYLPIFSIGRLL